MKWIDRMFGRQVPTPSQYDREDAEAQAWAESVMAGSRGEQPPRPITLDDVLAELIKLRSEVAAIRAEFTGSAAP
jgi:hypothetical protein